MEAFDKGKVRELCGDFREKRRMVGCLASRFRTNDGMEFGPSVREAWAQVNAKCGRK